MENLRHGILTELLKRHRSPKIVVWINRQIGVGDSKYALLVTPYLQVT